MEENKKIEIELAAYEKLLSENISLKKDMEYAKKENEKVIIETNSHSPVEELKKEETKKKGIF